jgi:cyanophycin synthetase
MARTARGEIIFFSMDEENPVIRDHLREQGRAVVLADGAGGGMLTLLEHKRQTSLLRAEEIPAALGGRVSVNIANALAAAAAAIGMDVPLECVRDALRAFTTDFAHTPGRFNLIDIDGRQVMMDYGHNVGALEAIADFVRRTGAPRSIGVITVPGDRRDEDVTAFGRLAATTFDEIIIREDIDPRGRPRGSMADLLVASVRDAGMSADRIRVVLDEVDAALSGVDHAHRGDLVVILADRPSIVWAALRTRAVDRPRPRAVALPRSEGSDQARNAVMERVDGMPIAATPAEAGQ